MSITEHQIQIVKFLQSTLRGSRNKIGFLTLEQARKHCEQNHEVISHSYTYGGDQCIVFSDCHSYGYLDSQNQLLGFCPSTESLPSMVVPRPGLETGVVKTLDDWIHVFANPEKGVTIISNFDEFVKFIDERDIYISSN